ncbi:MAG: class I SAM-dependent methyltransferase [Armatimonadota bacterium]|nr:class I SAM-dependent methyltransferase [bacterium]
MKESEAKRRNAKQALSHIEKLTQNGGRLLDVGCFCGLFLDVAKQYGWDCTGIEPLVMPSIYARGTFGLNIITDTLKEDSFQQEYFDIVTAFQVFEHIVKPSEELKKIYQFLKPGGLIVIEVPNIETAAVSFMGRHHRHFVEDHVNFFSEKTLTAFVEQYGFTKKKVIYPSRVLSMQQLVWWAGQYAGEGVAKFLKSILEHTHQSSKTVSINLKDIITVIAQKTS